MENDRREPQPAATPQRPDAATGGDARVPPALPADGAARPAPSASARAAGQAAQQAPPRPDPKIFGETRFNHDLLVEEGDRQRASRRWPLIAPMLVDAKLVENFMPFEEAAKREKSLVQRLGTAAVALMFVALLFSAFELWWEAGGPAGAPPTLPWYLGVAAETCGVLGLFAAMGASRFFRLRRSWLKNRFVTEVLRQWHFRRLLDTRRWQPAPGWDEDSYARERADELDLLLHELRGTVGQKMNLLVKDRSDPLDAIPQPQLPADPEARRQLLDAYRRLRLDHQFGFAGYKLSDEDKTFAGQSLDALMSGAQLLAGASLVLALVFSLARLISLLACWLAQSGCGQFEWTSFAAVALAVFGVAVRAWRDGLSLREEQQRYEEMRHRLGLLRARWDAAADDDARFAVAEELEQAVAEELRSFVQSHTTAQFLF